MSDRSESGSDGGCPDDVCRDYLRNVCKRGSRCKYRHPDSVEAQEFSKIKDYTFCHDFQNNGCRRPNCKFLHCSREEEDHCRKSGQLPGPLKQAASLGIGVDSVELVMKGGVPVCKDNLKGDCHRGAGCKYRHISMSEYAYHLHSGEQRRASDTLRESRDNADPFERFDYEHDTVVKRRRLDREFSSDGFNCSESRFSPNSKPLSYQLLEDENIMLRRKVEELKKQVSDLTATNEVLLEQNARYRVSKSTNSLLQSLNSPSGIQSQVQASSLNPLNVTLAQQLALSSDLASLTQRDLSSLTQRDLSSLSQRDLTSLSQQALQQRLVRELAIGQQAQQCSIAAPPTLNTATLSMNPPNIVAVSLPQTMSGLQPTNQNNNLQNMAPQTVQNASLVSYPVMSQGQRMTASSLAH